MPRGGITCTGAGKRDFITSRQTPTSSDGRQGGFTAGFAKLFRRGVIVRTGDIFGARACSGNHRHAGKTNALLPLDEV